MKKTLTLLLSLFLFSCDNEVIEGEGLKVISCSYIDESLMSSWRGKYQTTISSEAGHFIFYSNKKFTVGDIVTLSVIGKSPILPENIQEQLILPEKP